MNYKEMFAPDEIIDYLRKSRSDDPLLTVEEVLSKHEQILDDWSLRNLGAVVPPQNKFREVVSGETIADRPEFQRVLKLIESPKYKAIKVVEIERLSRGDLEDCGRLIKLLRYTGTYIITPQYVYDLTDERDRDDFERVLKQGNMYLEYFKKIQNRGRLQSVANGNFIGNKQPYGYERDWVMEGNKKCPTLKINEEQAEVVRLIYDMYVNQGIGKVNIGHKLDEMGIKPPENEHWSPYTIVSILKNIHYTGKVRWNGRKTVTKVVDGEIIASRPRTKLDDQIIFEGKHEAIISDELYNKAQAILGTHPPIKKSSKLRNPFAGLVNCQCGRAMSLRTYKRADGTERNAPRLLCDGQVYCGTGSCLFSEMQTAVENALKDKIRNFKLEMKDTKKQEISRHDKTLQMLNKRADDIKKREIALWEARTNPDEAQRMPDDVFKSLNAKLLREKANVENSIVEELNRTPESIDKAEVLKRFTDALKALQYNNLDANTKNRLLRACIDKIVYSRAPAKRATRDNTSNKLIIGGNWLAAPISLDIQFKV